MLRNSIRFAEGKLKAQALVKNGKTKKEVTKEVEQVKEEQVKEEPTKETGEIKEIVYTVNISLGKENIFPEGSTLIVYALPATGSKMPIAAKKIPIPTFPVQIKLSDNDAMDGSSKLSGHDKLIIKARISNRSDVKTVKGDWIGITESVTTDNSQEVDLQMSEVL